MDGDSEFIFSFNSKYFLCSPGIARAFYFTMDYNPNL